MSGKQLRPVPGPICRSAHAVYIAPEHILDILTGNLVSNPDLFPADARVVACSWCEETASIKLTVASDEYSWCAQGNHPYCMSLQLFKVGSEKERKVFGEG